MTTEQILQHIREVCGLKRLEFGCEVKLKNSNIIETMIDKARFYNDITSSICYFDGNREIIGLPVELSNLLYAIGKHDNEPHPIHIDWEWGSRNRNKIQITIAKGHPIINKEALYDLTLTVEQNLTDNTELRELIISLIK